MSCSSNQQTCPIYNYICINKNKEIPVFSLLFAFSLALISHSLVQKYTIWFINQGTPNTESQKGDNVEMHYQDTLANGKVFDSSYDRGSPFPLRIGSGQVIVCWDEVGLQLNGEQRLMFYAHRILPTEAEEQALSLQTLT